MKILVLGNDPETARAVHAALERIEARTAAAAIAEPTVVLVDGGQQSAAAWLAGMVDEHYARLRAMAEEPIAIRARYIDDPIFTGVTNGTRSKGDRHGRPRWPRPK